jgi:hypothetical protein
LAAAGCQSAPPPPPSAEARRAPGNGETRWITANDLRLKVKVYRGKRVGDRPTLVVALHGDSPLAPPSIQDVFALAAAERLDDAVVAGVLRPGYSDGSGDRSDGVRGRAMGDNYTPQVVDAVAMLVRELKVAYGTGPTILVGHSAAPRSSATSWAAGRSKPTERCWCRARAMSRGGRAT